MAFGGKPLEGHSIPEVYGAIQPTAVFVPIDQLVKDEHFELVTTEVFGPFQACPALGMHVSLRHPGYPSEGRGTHLIAIMVLYLL